MIPELGNFALILALCIAIVLAVIPLLGAQTENYRWMSIARPLAYGQLLFIGFSFFCLAYAFVTNDFSVAYVAENSNRHLPAWYRFAAVWGAHEGSMLLWVLILGLWTAAVAKFSRSLPPEVIARVLSVLGMVSVGFLLFTLATSNPFLRLLPNIPHDGQDLNPLLQDPGLVMHPPMLYMGYVGFSVAFAFAIAALISGRLDAAWTRWSRPWTLAAWCFLTLGITLGSWWAYRELGWGGWWFWDPVENASFMPWLVGTALIHCLAVAEKRGALKGWTALLAIFAFSLSLIGTFLVRSGVLTSVHAFAVDPKRGAFILVFLVLVIGASLLLYAWRAASLKSDMHFHLLSRETLLLTNNILLFVAAVTILLGTLYPLIMDALGLGKISVGPPYFNSVFIPLMAPMLFFMGLGPVCRWRQMEGRLLLRRLRFTFLVSLTLGIALPLVVTGGINGMVVLGMCLVFWVALTTLQDAWYRSARRGGMLHGFVHLTRSQYGMIFAHIGVAVCVVGITLSSHYSVERQVKMATGDIVKVGAYRFEFKGVHNIQGPNYRGVAGEFALLRRGREVKSVTAEKRTYNVQQMTMTDAGINAGIFRDLYVSLGEPLGDGSWSVRLYYKPFVRWIWLGGLLMMLGGLCALGDRRYRLAARHEEERLAQLPTQ